MWAVGNICSTCGCNYAEFPLVQCRREPYIEAVYHRRCEFHRTPEEWAAEMIIVQANYRKIKFLRRRVKRIAARKVRWAKFKNKEVFSQCRCCANNLADFPYVTCMTHPFGEIQFETDCDDHLTYEEYEDFLAYLFGNYDEIKKTHIPGVKIKWPL